MGGRSTGIESRDVVLRRDGERMFGENYDWRVATLLEIFTDRGKVTINGFPRPPVRSVYAKMMTIS